MSATGAEALASLDVSNIPARPKCGWASLPIEIEANIMGQLPLITDQLRLARTSRRLFRVLLQQQRDLFQRNTRLSLEVFVGHHFSIDNGPGQFDDRSSEHRTRVATMTRPRRKNQDVMSEASFQQFRLFVNGRRPLPPGANPNMSYMELFTLVGTHPRRLLAPHDAPAWIQEIHTKLRQLRQEDEDMRYTTVGGKGMALLENMEAFWFRRRPLMEFERCRATSCFRRTRAVKLMKSGELLYCEECFKEYCEEHLINFNVLEAVHILAGDGHMDLINCVTISKCHDGSGYLSEHALRQLLNLFFGTDVSLDLGQTFKVLGKLNQLELDAANGRWKICTSVSRAVYDLFRYPGGRDFSKYHINRYKMSREYAHAAYALAQPGSCWEMLKAAAEAYDKVGRISRSWSWSTWIEEHAAMACHRYLESEFGMITADRLHHVFGIRMEDVRQDKKYFVSLADARKAAEDMGTTLEQLMEDRKPRKRARLF